MNLQTRQKGQPMENQVPTYLGMQLHAPPQSILFHLIFNTIRTITFVVPQLATINAKQRKNIK